MLKNGCKVVDKEEDPEKVVKRSRKVEIRIQRLTEQLASRMPSCRDLTNKKFLETLLDATSKIPESDAQSRSWQDNLLKKPISIPFPVVFETSEDMVWLQNQKGRLCVHFNGLGEHTFEVYCDSRQLHWFKRFLEDQQIKRESKNQHSSSLFTLRCGRLAWLEGEGKGEPWDRPQLDFLLHC